MTNAGEMISQGRQPKSHVSVKRSDPATANSSDPANPSSPANSSNPQPGIHFHEPTSDHQAHATAPGAGGPREGRARRRQAPPLEPQHQVLAAAQLTAQPAPPATQPGLQPTAQPQPQPTAQPTAQPGMQPQPGIQPQPNPGAQPIRTAAPAHHLTGHHPPDQHLADIGPMQTSRPNLGVFELIQEVIGRIEDARSMPLSGSAMVDRDELLALLDEALGAFPVELQQARWQLRDRDELLQRAATDASLIIDEARSRVAQMVQNTEVVRSAERRARQLIDDAEAQARRRKHEIDDYCERRLAKFDGDLTQILQRVQAARQKLSATSSQSAPQAQAHPNVPITQDPNLTQPHPGMQQNQPLYQGQPGMQQNQPLRDPTMVRTAPGTDPASAQPTRPLMFDQERA